MKGSHEIEQLTPEGEPKAKYGFRILETATMTMIVRVFSYVALITVPSSQEEGGMKQMIVVKEDALLNIPAERERVTVSMTLTVSTLAGQDVAMICV